MEFMTTSKLLSTVLPYPVSQCLFTCLVICVSTRILICILDCFQMRHSDSPLHRVLESIAPFMSIIASSSVIMLWLITFYRIKYTNLVYQKGILTKYEI